MNKSASQRHFPPQEMGRSPSRRAIYFNEETNRKEVSTSFHSPYKDGRPNPNYFNPSFVSSHLLYPKQYLEPQQKQVIVTKNCIPNINDTKKDTLYRQRLRTEQASRSKTREKDYRKNREFNKQRETHAARIFRVNEPQTLLRNQLGNLHNYRQDYEQKQERIKDLSRRILQPEIPIYLQNPRRPGESTWKARGESTWKARGEQSKTVDLQQYMAVAKELSELKRELKRNNIEIENRNMDKLIIQNKELLLEEQAKHRKESQLLGNILREQIRTNDLRKEKKWNY